MASGIAVHQAAVLVYFDNVEMDGQFWGIRQAAYGIDPDLANDDDGAVEPYHSYRATHYYGPWDPGGLLGPCDLLIRAHGEVTGSLEAATWASMKAVF